MPKGLRKKTNPKLKINAPKTFSPRVSHSHFFAVIFILCLLLAIPLVGLSFQLSSLSFGRDLTPTEAMEAKIDNMVEGYPIADMSPYIAEQNQTTAAYLIAIAKKESDWGKRSPHAEDGTDCYNYWGFKGEGSRGFAQGHGCFGTPEEAVSAVSSRIDTLVNDYKLDTPQELIVWKCGWSCEGHSVQGVKKWIQDVGYYFRKFE